MQHKFKTGSKAIKQQQNSIFKRGGAVANDVWSNAVSCVEHAYKVGKDGQRIGDISLLSRLVNNLPISLNKKLLMAWLKRHNAGSWVAADSQFKMTRKDADIETMKVVNPFVVVEKKKDNTKVWSDLEIISSALTRIENRLKDGSKTRQANDVVHVGMVDELEKILSKYRGQDAGRVQDFDKPSEVKATIKAARKQPKNKQTNVIPMVDKVDNNLTH